METVVRAELVDYIRLKCFLQPRYDIDFALLQQGYDPAEIEAAWQQVYGEQSESHQKLASLHNKYQRKTFWRTFFKVGLLLLVVAGLIIWRWLTPPDLTVALDAAEGQWKYYSPDRYRIVTTHYDATTTATLRVTVVDGKVSKVECRDKAISFGQCNDTALENKAFSYTVEGLFAQAHWLASNRKSHEFGWNGDILDMNFDSRWGYLTSLTYKSNGEVVDQYWKVESFEKI
jgi:hypothetical protein